MATIYVSPTGTGSKTGSSAANALPITSLDKAIELAGAGGTVKMLADKGAYNLSSPINIFHGGTATAPVTIIGVDSYGNEQNIEIYGTRPANWQAGMAAGNEVFKLLGGANNLVFENMSFYNVAAAFRAGANISNITIEDMYADNVRRFFEDCASTGYASATVTGLTIRNVEVHDFSKSVIRLQYNTNNVLIENVWGDSERQEGDGIPIGVHLDGTVHNVVIRDTTMMNAQSSADDYWNGDGFATEYGVYGITFENTVAIGNADAGYDLKSADTTLINAVAEGNCRNFRLWGEVTLIEPVGLDPHKYGGTSGQAQIQILSGAVVTVQGGDFADSGSATKVVVGAGGKITFAGTSFVYASDSLQSGSNIFGIDPALVVKVSTTGLWSTNGAGLIGTSGAQSYAGTTGEDTFVAPNDANWTVAGLAGNDHLTTGAGADRLTGGEGADVISAGAGNDVITFKGDYQGFDAIFGGSGDDHILAMANGTIIGLSSISGIERVSANGFSEVAIQGSGGADVLDFSSVVLEGIKCIAGGAGNDTIIGSAIANRIVGGPGADQLTGSGGKDVFDWNTTNDSKPASADTVTDFVRGTDIIDLDSIDAVTIRSGNQNFIFIGNSEFSGDAGELRYYVGADGSTYIKGDVNGDKVADFGITLVGAHQLTSSDFIL